MESAVLKAYCPSGAQFVRHTDDVVQALWMHSIAVRFGWRSQVYCLEAQKRGYRLVYAESIAQKVRESL